MTRETEAVNQDGQKAEDLLVCQFLAKMNILFFPSVITVFRLSQAEAESRCVLRKFPGTCE